MSLQLIYHFRSSEKDDTSFIQASYGVVFCFDKDGLVDMNLLRELSKTVPDADHYNLKFLNLDDLKSFAMRVSEELSSNDVRLLSVQDYNIGLDGAKDLSSYRDIFQKYGEVVESENSKKKGFLKKFFS